MGSEVARSEVNVTIILNILIILQIWWRQVELNTRLDTRRVLRPRQDSGALNQSAVVSFLRNSALHISAGTP